MKGFKMIRVVIVDDERNSLELVESQLLNMNQFKVIGAFMNPLKAYENIVSLKPELVITDIEMPGLSGVELAKKVLANHPNIQFVFLTAYKQYAIEAFDLNAVRYLLKPVSKKDLEKIYSRIRNTTNHQKNKTNANNKIFTLGDFSVINTKGKRVEFPTSKVEELFALLIMNRSNGVGKWKIINELWDISEIKNPLQNLYTTIYRLRKVFIKYELPYDVKKISDHYLIELRNTYFDYEEYNKLIKKLKGIEISKNNLIDFKKITKLYAGDLFMYNDYIWCIYDRRGLSNKYNSVLKKMRKFYKVNDMQTALLEVNQLIEKNNN